MSVLYVKLTRLSNLILQGSQGLYIATSHVPAYLGRDGLSLYAPFINLVISKCSPILSCDIKEIGLLNEFKVP